MSLNIKNERTVALIAELAALTGASKTSAIEDAVRCRLADLAAGGEVGARDPERREIADRLLRDIRRSIAETGGTWRDYEAAELYDEFGAPR